MSAGTTRGGTVCAGSVPMPERLAEIIAAADRAVFHGPPGPAMAALEQARLAAASALTSSTGSAPASGPARVADVPHLAWLTGVALQSLGRYAEALEVLRPLMEVRPDDPDRAVVGGLAAATVASVLRQVGQHEAASEADLHGLRLAQPVGSAGAVAVADCLAGLAADAVGLGHGSAAAVRLVPAAEATERLPASAWRSRVRVQWVATEVALLTGATSVALLAARDALGRSEEAAAPRHVAKSLLFLGVVEVEIGLRPQGLVTLRRAAALSEALGCVPLVWPARLVLARELAESDPAAALACRLAARDVVRRIAEGLPASMRDRWLDRDDLRALFDGEDFVPGV